MYVSSNESETLFGLVILLVAAGLFGFWFWALTSCLRSDMPSGKKLVWIVVIIFLNVLGALLYFTMRPDRTDGLG